MARPGFLVSAQLAHLGHEVPETSSDFLLGLVAFAPLMTETKPEAKPKDSGKRNNDT
jgi:hypothetical protein